MSGTAIAFGNGGIYGRSFTVQESRFSWSSRMKEKKVILKKSLVVFSVLATLLTPLGFHAKAHAAPVCAPASPTIGISQLSFRPHLLTDSRTAAYAIHAGSYAAPSLLAYDFLSGTTTTIVGPSPTISYLQILDTYFDGTRFRILFNENEAQAGGYVTHRLKLFTSHSLNLTAGGTTILATTGSTSSGLNSIDSHRVARASIDNGYIVLETQHRTGPFWNEIFTSDISVSPLQSPANQTLVASINGIQGNSAIENISVLTGGTALWTERLGYNVDRVIKAKNYLAGSGVAPISLTTASADAQLQGLIEERVIGANIYLSSQRSSATLRSLSATLLPSFTTLPIQGSYSNNYNQIVVSDLRSPFSGVQFMALPGPSNDSKIQTLEAVPQEVTVSSSSMGEVRKIVRISGSVILEELSTSGPTSSILGYTLHVCAG